jgi:hypothetical protein
MEYTRRHVQTDHNGEHIGEVAVYVAQFVPELCAR